MVKHIAVSVIGGNDAFSKDNSSFLIHLPTEDNGINILFDCGPSTFEWYKKTKPEIDYVFISHTHFDHIGGLEQLIFYRYYVEGKRTSVIVDGKIGIELMELLKDCNKSYVNGEIEHISIVNFVNKIEISDRFSIGTIEGNHIVKENYGIMVADEHAGSGLIITGDTKASYKIKKIIKGFLSIGYKVHIFHDYSTTFNDPANNIHACSKDMKFIYEDLLRNDKVTWYKYHNYLFNKQYKNKTIFIK